MRQYDDAKREFEAELVVDPENPQALAYLGDIEMKRNDPDQACHCLRRLYS
jgi:predicted Zn-dependent protease